MALDLKKRKSLKLIPISTKIKKYWIPWIFSFFLYLVAPYYQLPSLDYSHLFYSLKFQQKLKILRKYRTRNLQKTFGSKHVQIKFLLVSNEIYRNKLKYEYKEEKEAWRQSSRVHLTISGTNQAENGTSIIKERELIFV